MNITRWEPFREVEDMFRQYSPFFSRALRQSSGEEGSWRPVADISETDQEYLIKAELPEVKKEDVKVTFEDGLLTISGERRNESRQKNENEIRVESFYGSFTRSFSLPDNIDAKSIRAESKDGVLRVRIPKTAASEARKPLRTGLSAARVSADTCVYPKMAVKILLKSWAIPPARLPMASSFCDCCSSSSVRVLDSIVLSTIPILSVNCSRKFM